MNDFFCRASQLSRTKHMALSRVNLIFSFFDATTTLLEEKNSFDKLIKLLVVFIRSAQAHWVVISKMSIPLNTHTDEADFLKNKKVTVAHLVRQFVMLMFAHMP